MDLSKLKTNDWLKVGGAAGMLVFGFFNWVKLDIPGFESVAFGNVFDFEVRGLISWVLVIGVGVLTFLTSQGKKVGSMNWPMLSIFATGIATILMLLLVVAPGEGLKSAIGSWLAFISTVVAFVGSILAFTSGGGNLKDLTDVNKLKDSFGQG